MSKQILIVEEFLKMFGANCRCRRRRRLMFYLPTYADLWRRAIRRVRNQMEFEALLLSVRGRPILEQLRAMMESPDAKAWQAGYHP